MGWKTGNWPRCAIILIVTVAIANCDNSVHILSNYRQHITSSTLNWLPINHYEASKEDNLVIGGYQRAPKSAGTFIQIFIRSFKKSLFMTLRLCVFLSSALCHEIDMSIDDCDCSPSRRLDVMLTIL